MYAHEIMQKEANELGFQKGVEIVAMKLWQHGFQPSKISNILDLPIERIELLIAEFKKQGED